MTHKLRPVYLELSAPSNEEDTIIERHSGKPNAVVVEDDEDLLHLEVALLEEEGYRVKGVMRGQEALDLIHQKKPDVVLLDLALPDISGYQVIKKLRTQHKSSVTPPIRILVLSASTELRHNEIPAGADGALKKPFDLNELLDKLAEWGLVPKHK